MSDEHAPLRYDAGDFPTIMVSPYTDSKHRFSARVEHYVKYRPGYPDAVLSLLHDACGLTSSTVVADIGSGTGLSAEPFLKNGNVVYAVEPNDAMRDAAERLLASRYPNFRSVAASAEATTLADASVDLIVAGQAFHWFDRVKTRKEFARILRPGGCVVILWNKREIDTTPFLREYEDLLLRFGTDYGSIRHENIREPMLREFFAPNPLEYRTFPNEQRFDFEGIRGRLLSSSYVPTPGQTGHDEMLAKLRAIFDRHQQGGIVVVRYTTQVYFGRLDGAAQS